MTNNALTLPSLRGYFLTFRVGEQWYAVNVQMVFEVANMVAITSVPDMPESVLGVVNVRGSIVPVLDLRVRFNKAERAVELTTPIIFVHHGTSLFGLVVDDIDDVIQLTPDSISTTELKQRAEHIHGLTDYKGRLIMILDPMLLMASSLKEQTLDQINAKIQPTG